MEMTNRGRGARNIRVWCVGTRQRARASVGVRGGVGRRVAVGVRVVRVRVRVKVVVVVRLRRRKRKRRVVGDDKLAGEGRWAMADAATRPDGRLLVLGTGAVCD